jgi:hypothetical protein
MSCPTLDDLIAKYVMARSKYTQIQNFDTFKTMLNTFDKICSHTGLDEVQAINLLKSKELL